MNWLKNVLSSFTKNNIEEAESMQKFLIVGLGNFGSEYEQTRHNIGFKVVEHIATKKEAVFSNIKLGALTQFKFKGRLFYLLKPATYMNLSGKAVKYWLEKESIPIEHLMIICDDINLPFGTIRIKPNGSDGGHNGLKSINEYLNTQQYIRFRFGIGSEFSKGQQSSYVLGEWDEEEKKLLPERLDKSIEAIISFGTAGIHNTMNTFNGK